MWEICEGGKDHHSYNDHTAQADYRKMLKKKSIFNNWIFIDDAFYIYCFLPFLFICHLICYNMQKVDIWSQNKTEKISIYMREQLINME